MRVVSKTPAQASRWMDIRERILVEVLINGTIEQAAIQQQFEGCDIGEDVQWLVDAALLERSGSSDNPVLARGRRLGPGR